MAYLDVANTSNYCYPGTLIDDLVVYTNSNTQRIFMGVGSNTTNTMVITSNAVAINKSNAAFALDVNGVVNASALYVGGTPYIGSQWANSNNIVYLLGSNVSIGKSNPAFPLDVNGIINATALYVGGVPYIGSQWSNNSTNVFLFGSNVGLGTNTPQAMLQMASNSTNYVLHTNASNANGFYTGIENTSDINGGFNALVWNASNAAIRFGTSNVERMRITSNGFVGIGRSNPQVALDVVGSVNVTSNLTVAGTITTCNIAVSNITIYNINVAQSNLAVGAAFSNAVPPANGLIVQGFTGIGTSNPASQLSVAGGATVGTAYSNIAAPTNGLAVQSNLSVNTTTPTELLHVQGGSVYATVQHLGNSNDSASVPSFGFKEDSNTGIFHASNDSLGFSTNGLERMRITDAGFVGINNNNPQSTVDIIGTTTIRGNFQINNSVGIRGLTIYKRDGTMANITTSSVQGFSNDGTGVTLSVASNNATTSFKFVGNTTEVARLTGAGFLGIGTNNPSASLDMSQRTDAVILPQGTTAQRPATPSTGMYRFNTTIGAVEYYNGFTWVTSANGTLYFNDGSTLAGWTVSGASVNASVGNPPPSLQATSAQYAYVLPFGLTTLYNTTIMVNMQLIYGICADFFFGCASNGAGYMLRLECRGGTPSGIATTTNWTSWGIPSGPALSISTGVWYSVKIQITGSGATSFFLNGALQQTANLTLQGAYIGIQGDGAGAYYDSIYIYSGIV